MLSDGFLIKCSTEGPQQELSVVWRRGQMGTDSPEEAWACGQSASLALRQTKVRSRVPLTLDKSCCVSEPRLSHLQSAYKMTCLIAVSGLNVITCKACHHCWHHGC